MTVGNKHLPAGWQVFRMTRMLTFETASKECKKRKVCFHSLFGRRSIDREAETVKIDPIQDIPTYCPDRS